MNLFIPDTRVPAARLSAAGLLPRTLVGKRLGTHRGRLGGPLGADQRLDHLADFNAAPPAGGAFTQHLWKWFAVGGFDPEFHPLPGWPVADHARRGHRRGLSDPPVRRWYMRGEEGYSRFFAYTNLFIFSMLMLVLGDNLLVLYFGWEGVGLCSYLLIGFYFKHVPNGNAALKAFIVTRIGDVFMAIGLFILFVQLGTLNIQELMVLAPQKFTSGDPWMTWPP